MTTRDTGKPTTLLPLAALFATLLLFAVAAFLPSARLWGINHLAYYPAPLRLLLLALIAASFLPWVAGKALHRIEWTLEVFRARRRLRVLVFAVVPILAFLLFLSFRSSTRILGDGQVVANDLEVPYRGDSTQVVPTLKAITHGDHIAPGTTMLFYLAGVAHLRLGGNDPVLAAQIVSCFLGSVLIVLLLVAALRRTVPVPMVIWLLVLTCSSGAVELFFGYVENYALLVVLGTVYAISGIRVLNGTGRLWVAVVTLVVATFAHVSGVLLVPSMALLLWHAWRREEASHSYTVVTGAILAATILAVVIVALTPMGERFLVPLRGRDNAYGFFSPARWADLANEILLLMPHALVVATMIVLLMVKRPTDRVADSGRAVEYFVTLILIPQLLYLIAFNPEIGMGRDWDLFTPVAIGLVALALVVLLRFQARFPATMTLLTFPALVMGLVIGTAWIGVNASLARSTERFEHILEYTKSRRDYAYEVLSRTYYDNGMLPQAIRAMEKASTLSKNPRHYYTLSGYYREYGDITASQELLRRLLVRRPGYLPARKEYVMTLFEQRDYEGALEAAKAGLDYHPNVAFFYLCIGKSLIRLNRPDEAREALLQGKPLATDAGIKHEIDQDLQRLGTN